MSLKIILIYHDGPRHQCLISFFLLLFHLKRCAEKMRSKGRARKGNITMGRMKLERKRGSNRGSERRWKSNREARAKSNSVQRENADACVIALWGKISSSSFQIYLVVVMSLSLIPYVCSFLLSLSFFEHFLPVLSSFHSFHSSCHRCRFLHIFLASIRISVWMNCVARSNASRMCVCITIVSRS